MGCAGLLVLGFLFVGCLAVLGGGGESAGNNNPPAAENEEQQPVEKEQAAKKKVYGVGDKTLGAVLTATVESLARILR